MPQLSHLKDMTMLTPWLYDANDIQSRTSRIEMQTALFRQFR